ncbi:hypothetical protein, partial [Streptomyces sp. SID8014]|uniref:hypothetical protein n=1 Tax=Streptomyces sp. SID8014 TaxID=2706097 RepID=UPI001941E30F
MSRRAAARGVGEDAAGEDAGHGRLHPRAPLGAVVVTGRPPALAGGRRPKEHLWPAGPAPEPTG